MTFTEWLRALEEHLAALPPAERQRAAEFYKELYSDEKETGMSEAEILSGLGSPAHAAAEILGNFAETGENGQIKAGMPEKNGTEAKEKSGKKDGVLFIPRSKLIAGLGAAALAFLLGSFALGIAGSVLAGELALLAMGITLLLGGTATLAAGLIVSGIFVLLAVPVYYAIKYIGKGVIWAVRKFYKNLLTEAKA